MSTFQTTSISTALTGWKDKVGWKNRITEFAQVPLKSDHNRYIRSLLGTPS